MSRPDNDHDTPRALFERASERLDHGMAFRLRRAREAALQGRAAKRPAWGVPAGAFAAAVLALGLAWWLPAGPGPSTAAPEALAVEDIDALVVAEDAELYAWLAEAPVAAPGGPR
ncbi:hypothetical protein [Arenimonas sp.]|uniref:hypothetical protein n=1 Tax=Arenimonas sp. TaxID=1872635 RepID=UPI0025CC6730|nr:hypothetical protein [Arenimonas sp.]